MKTLSHFFLLLLMAFMSLGVGYLHPNYLAKLAGLTSWLFWFWHAVEELTFLHTHHDPDTDTNADGE